MFRLNIRAHYFNGDCFHLFIKIVNVFRFSVFNNQYVQFFHMLIDIIKLDVFLCQASVTTLIKWDVFLSQPSVITRIKWYVFLSQPSVTTLP